MITWVAHNFFYWFFNASLWLMGRTIAVFVRSLRTISKRPLADDAEKEKAE